MVGLSKEKNSGSTSKHIHLEEEYENHVVQGGDEGKDEISGVEGSLRGGLTVSFTLQNWHLLVAK